MRPPGSAQSLEQRRLQAIRLLKAGRTYRDVATIVGASLSSVVRWQQSYQSKGNRGLRVRPSPGRTPGLDQRKRERLAQLLLEGPMEAGYETNIWTLRRIAEVIHREFDVRYTIPNVWRLMRAMGWSCQKPTKRDRERNEKAIRYWKQHVWPRIKKTAELVAHSGFLDESGFLLVPTISRTWAPRGQTPVLTTAGNWTKVSATSALTVSPKRRRRGLYCQFHPNKNIRAPQVIQFLRHLLRHIRGHIVLLWDGGQPHRADMVKAFLQRHRRLQVHPLPAYAPELNPDELVWNHMKRALANSLPRDTKSLHRQLYKPLRRLRRSQRLLRSCINASELPWNL